ncbi:unnamed protein product [Rotaria magnacalcarata]|uniref:histone deacetylase n=1 Tax=Rotaria magnacalcarata TaxID=392030 RepID=A0A816YCL9_9BILA|nr:unnamed protein product [Rotaria magnacalcarata]
MFIHTWSESHVEQPYRLTRIIDDLHNYFWISHQLRWKGIPGRMVNNDEIRLVHSEEFLSGFFVGPIVARACRTAAGTTINLISSVVRRDIDIGFAFCAAGHHSSTDKVGAFCGLNSVSIGAVYAIQFLRLDRVLVLDWDVHRSEGTEQILGQISNEDKEKYRQISNEDKEKYRLIDIFAAFGKSSNSTSAPLNCHLIDMFNRNQLAGDDEYLNVFDKNILPDIIQFQPSLILISAGFDAAQCEAERCAQLTPNGYFQMTKKLKELKIPLVFIFEGGYQQKSLIQSIRATFEALFDI